jgi:hypothetical protein
MGTNQKSSNPEYYTPFSNLLEPRVCAKIYSTETRASRTRMCVCRRGTAPAARVPSSENEVNQHADSAYVSFFQVK